MDLKGFIIIDERIKKWYTMYMDIKEYLPVWDKLSDADRQRLSSSVMLKKFNKKTIIHNGKQDCSGLFIVVSGELRVYTLSDSGREITISRLFERDICLLSASCMLNGIQFDVVVETLKDTEALVIPAEIYKSIMNVSAPLANFTNKLMSDKFSEVMWLLDQIMWKSFDKRLAKFLLDESAIENTRYLSITHEEIGNHLGSPREVVTRMLKYFQGENLVELSRGTIKIVNAQKLNAII